MADKSQNSPASDTGSKIVLLEEGFDEGCVPQVVVVRQGDKVFFPTGQLDKLSTSDVNEAFQHEGKLNIVEDADKLDITETDAGHRFVKGGNWYFEGIFQRSDTKNLNQRIYPRKIWERLVGDNGSSVQKMVARRAMVGHNEHPEDGRTKLNDYSMLTTSLRLRDDVKEGKDTSKGIVWGAGTILNTPQGRLLQEYSLQRIPWGVSSRGHGGVASNGIVEDNFTLRTFDAVSNPSTPDAYPKAAFILGGRTANESVDDELPPEVLRLLDEAEAVLTERASSVETARRLVRVMSGLTALEPVHYLHSRVQSVRQQMAAALPDVVGRTLRVDSDPDERDTDESDVSESLTEVQRQLVEAEAENTRIAEVNETLTERAERLEEAAEVAAQAVREESEDHQRTAEALSESETIRKRLKRRVRLLTSQLAEASEEELVDSLTARLDGIIKLHPELTRFKDLLKGCKTEADLVRESHELLALSSGNAANAENGITRKRTKIGTALSEMQLDEGVVDKSAAKGGSSDPSTRSRAQRDAAAAVRTLTGT